MRRKKRDIHALFVAAKASEYDQEMPRSQTTLRPVQGTKRNRHIHWRSSHYAGMHVRNKNNVKGRSPYVVKVIFHTIRNFS